MEMQPENQDRNKQEIITHDFYQIFREKLSTIKSTVKEPPHTLKELGVHEIIKEAPAIIFGLNEDDKYEPDLWITDPENIPDMYAPHADVRRDLGIFLNGMDPQLIGGRSDQVFPDEPIFPAKIIQDADNFLYLLIDGDTVHFFEKKKNEYLIEQLFNVAQKYKIKKVIGSLSDSFDAGEKKEMFINEDLIGEQREDLHLLEIAQEYNMDTTQYMRFIERAKSIIDAMKEGKVGENERPIDNLRKFAEEIMEETEE